MTIALVSGQTAVTLAASAQTATVTLPNNPASGNFVVTLFCWFGNSSGTFTIQDGNSNTYTKTTNSPFNDNTNLNEFIIAYLPNVPSNGSKSITYSTGVGGADMIIFAAEFSGVATSSPFDVDATVLYSGTTASTTVSKPAVTTAVNGELVVNITSPLAAFSSVNSPWTAIQTAQDSNAVWAEYTVQSTAGSQAPGYTLSSAQTWEGMTAAFKPAAGGGASVTPWRRRQLVYRRF